MTDREKVIKGLEICYCPPAKCEDCPYHDLPDEQSCNDTLCLDALALLKEQEEETSRLTKMCKVLLNRCKTIVNADGATCAYCTHKEECDKIYEV